MAMVHGKRSLPVHYYIFSGQFAELSTAGFYLSMDGWMDNYIFHISYYYVKFDEFKFSILQINKSYCLCLWA